MIHELKKGIHPRPCGMINLSNIISYGRGTLPNLIDNWCDKSGIRTYEDVYKKKIKMVPTEEIHLFQEEELRKYDVSGFNTDKME